MKSIKRSLALILCMAILLSSLMITPIHADDDVIYGDCGVDGDNVKWYFYPHTGSIVIKGIGRMENYYQHIIDDADDIAPWSTYRNSIKTVTVNGVENIGSEAFYGCGNLTSASIGSGVQVIGTGAFEGCDSLSSVGLGSVDTIGAWAFWGCTSLSSVTIPDSVTEIGGHAFYGCTALSSLTLGKNVKYIGSYAFSHCSLLSSVTIPAKVKEIGDYAFDSCSSLTAVTVPGNVESIGSYAFANCTSLTSAMICEGVKSIGDYAFSGCTSLTSTGIPDSVTRIGYYLYSGCDSLTLYEYDNGLYFGNPDNPYCVFMKATDDKIATCEIHPDTKVISDKALYKCESLFSVSIPEGVKGIGNEAFYKCGHLATVNIPDSVTSIGEDAFSYCYGLRLNRYDNGCYLGNTDHPYIILIQPKDTDIQTCKIHPLTKMIHTAAFANCTSLTEVTIPECVTSIGKSAFFNCVSLTSVTIPSQVTTIQYGTFEQCRGLTSATIGNGVTSIGEHAFYFCWSLASVTIPAGVTELGFETFWGCIALKSVYFKGSQEQWDSLEQINYNLVADYGSTVYCNSCNGAAEHDFDASGICKVCGAGGNGALLPGDINCNGKIESNDYILLHCCILKIGNWQYYPITSAAGCAADLNKNGEFDSNDYVMLRKLILGIR